MQRLEAFKDIYDCFSRLYIALVFVENFWFWYMLMFFLNLILIEGALINNLDSLFNYAELTKDIDPSLVAIPEIEYMSDYKESYLLEKEKEVFGFYLSAHPTSIYRKDNPYTIFINQMPNFFNRQVDTLILVEKNKRNNY